MPKLLFPETHEHGPAEYRFTAEEIASMATWDEIGEWLEDNVEHQSVVEGLMSDYRVACANEDDEARERIEGWLSEGIEHGYSAMLAGIWKHDTSFFQEDIEAWAKEEESKQ